METTAQSAKKPEKQKRHTFDNGTTWLFYWMSLVWVGTEAFKEGGWFNWLMLVMICLYGCGMAHQLYQEKQKERAKSDFNLT